MIHLYQSLSSIVTEGAKTKLATFLITYQEN